MRFVARLLAGLATAAPSLALAQSWLLDGGVVARGEYNDNYFLTSENAQSAFTASVTPFVTVARRTESSSVAGIAAVGGNWVSGASSNTDYVSGLFGLDGSLREARSTWAGNLSFVRSATLQTEAQDGGVVLGLAYTNAASAGGSYTYALTERWSLGATVSGYDNRYDSVDNSGTFVNNHGYYAGGNAAYAYSEVTQLSANVGYSYYTSDLSHSDSATATLGIVHRFSPQLTVSASGGGFWSDTTAAQGALAGSSRRATGGLFGGQIAYDFSENSQIVASLAENLAPSGTGVLSKYDNARLMLSSKLSDRLTGRLGASYSRTTFPQAQTNSFNYNYYQGEIGVSYRLAEWWTLDAGYRYTRARYTESSSEPTSNVAFVTIGYNWPGASFTGWVGRPADMQGVPGAGPLSLPVNSRGQTGAAQEPASSEGSPFDPFSIP